jgi:hypothetical protein
MESASVLAVRLEKQNVMAQPEQKRKRLEEEKKKDSLRM